MRRSSGSGFWRTERGGGAVGGADWGLDEDFLAALAFGMPPSVGIALGFDRMAMIAGGGRQNRAGAVVPPVHLG